MYKFIAVILSLMLYSTSAHSSQSNQYLEVDPGSYVFDGYSLNYFRNYPNRHDYRIGVAIFSFEFPDFIINSNPDNKGEEWSLRTKQGFDLYVDKFVSRSDKIEWFVGFISVYFENELSNDSISESRSRFTQISNGLRSGLIWFPFDSDFYVSPWLAITHNSVIRGDTKIANKEYSVPVISPFATLHIGYKF
ncbi:MAG: hypothetical protein OEX00_08670 [Gammaproteobacteria bacterium]|nr:hypothetical protein [Gammaproteobacteria bacterium]MDH5693770.1 hypothetical protein [Gammaproteobacteria bacterium]